MIEKPTLGFVGVGVMGERMCGNLARNLAAPYLPATGTQPRSRDCQAMEWKGQHLLLI